MYKFFDLMEKHKEIFDEYNQIFSDKNHTKHADHMEFINNQPCIVDLNLSVWCGHNDEKHCSEKFLVMHSPYFDSYGKNEQFYFYWDFNFLYNI